MSDPATGGRGARARILAAARELFYRRGINQTGIAELCAVAHVSRRTLYQHFAGKDELIAAYLEAFERDGAFAAEAILARGDLAPRARLLELFDALAEGERPLRGDPWINAAIELPDPSAEVREAVSGHARRFCERLTGLARALGASDADGLGRRLALLYAGAAAQVVVDDDAEPAEVARAVAAQLIRRALGEPAL